MTRSENAGFTFVEMAISLTVFALLLTSVFTITFETSSFVRDNDDQVSVIMDGNRASERFLEILRKSGRITIGGVTYPRVINGGAELELRILRDLDSNGYAFSAATGALEWHPSVFTLKADASGFLDVYQGATVVYRLGEHIQNLRFETFLENPALKLRQVRMLCEARKSTGKGFDAVHSIDASVHMRN